MRVSCSVSLENNQVCLSFRVMYTSWVMGSCAFVPCTQRLVASPSCHFGPGVSPLVTKSHGRSVPTNSMLLFFGPGGDLGMISLR